MCQIWVYSHLLWFAVCTIVSWAIWIFHGSSPRTGLFLVLLPNHLSEVWRLEKNAICSVAIFSADARRSIAETAETNGNGGVFIFKKCIWKKKKRLNRSVCWELKLLPSRATLASSMNAPICTQTSALSALWLDKKLQLDWIIHDTKMDYQTDLCPGHSVCLPLICCQILGLPLTKRLSENYLDFMFQQLKKVDYQDRDASRLQ